MNKGPGRPKKKSRVFEGKTVIASEKIVSLFEDHGDIIMTGKKNDPLFGHKILLIEIEGYEKIQEKSPDLVALDRGFYSNQNKMILGEWGVKQVCLHGERV